MIRVVCSVELDEWEIPKWAVQSMQWSWVDIQLVCEYRIVEFTEKSNLPVIEEIDFELKNEIQLEIE